MTPLVPAGPALLCGLVLFLLPGLVFLAGLRREDRASLLFDEALFLIVGVSVALSSWVALVLAEIGVFSLPRGALVTGTVSTLAALGAAARGRLTLPGSHWTGLRAIAPALVVLALALALQTRPSEYVVGGRDPGTYIAGMALVARTGSVAYVDPVVLSIPRADIGLFYRADGPWGRFMGMPLESPESGRVVPEFFHLFPAFGAYLFAALGIRGALAAPCVFGVLGTLAALLAWRRVFGTAVGWMAAVLLSLNVIQVWFGRYPVAEPMAEFLVFLALWAFALWEERGAPMFGLLAGTALGLTLLVRIDNVLILVPLGVYLLVRRLQGALPWSRARAIVLPVLLLAGHALVHAAFWARKYLLSVVNRPYWQQPWWVWLALTAAVVAVLLVAHRFEPRVARWMDAHDDALPGLALATLLDNHDMNRFLWMAGGDVSRLKLAATLLMTLPGMPVIYYGTEVGLTQRHDGVNENAEARLPMLWGLDQDGDLLRFFSNLVSLRRHSAALRRGSRKTLHADAHELVYERVLGDERMVVTLNLETLSGSVVDGSGRERLRQDDVLGVSPDQGTG